MSTTDSADAPTFHRPKVILPVPTPSPKFQHVQAGFLTPNLLAKRLLREFGTPLLFNHSHRVFFWANELGRQTGKKFDAAVRGPGGDGIPQAEFTIGVSGCGGRTILIVTCAEGGDGCFAAPGRR